MSSLSLVNDLSVSRSDVLERTAPVVISTTQTLDFNSSGFSPLGALYYICGAATTITFPVNYSRYKGRVVHISANGGAVSVSASSTTSGSVFDITGSSVNGTEIASSGRWLSLICDGSTGWLVFATDSA